MIILDHTLATPTFGLQACMSVCLYTGINFVSVSTLEQGFAMCSL